VHQLEDWQSRSSSDPTGSSKSLSLISDFQIRIATSAKKVSTRNGERDPLPGIFKRRIKENFVDTLCFLFDGVLSAAMAPEEKKDGRRGTRVSNAKLTTMKDIVRPGRLKTLMKQETRLLLTLAKFNLLRQTVLPQLINKVARLLDIEMSHDEQLLQEVVEGMDQVVFEDYVKRRSEALVTVIQDGILRGGIDWLNAPKPTGALFGTVRN
jgi:exocyst complex component 2